MLEVREHDGQKGIYGLAAPFYDGTERTEFVLWDDGNNRVVERIMPEFFDAALERGDDVRGLYNHDSNYVLGRTASGTLDLEKTEDGLRYSIPNPPAARQDVIEALERGDVDGSSFAFTIEDENVKTDGGLTVIELRKVGKLMDVGPVAFPAYGASESEARDGRHVRAVTAGGGTVQVRSCDVRCRRDQIDKLLAERAAAEQGGREQQWRHLEMVTRTLSRR